MRIGAHESIAGGVSQAFARARAHGGRAMQIFTKTARAWSAPALADVERRAFRREAKRVGLPVIAHGSYLANLAARDLRIRARSLACLADELGRCERLGISHLVIHPGCHADVDRGLTLIARGLDELLARARPRRARLCLEVTAGQGNALGWRFEHLAEILSRTWRESSVAVCLDTCHLFSAGYDISTRRGYERVMGELDRTVGIQRVACLHLNDSKRPLGARVDRHESIGKGTLGLTPFRCLVNDPRLAGAIGVVETPAPQRYGEEIRLLESLASL